MDPQIIGPISGAIIALCGAFLAYLRARDRLRYMALCVTATPEQLAALQRMPVPPPLSAGGPLLLLIVGFLLAVAVPVLAGQAHPVATMERLGVLPIEQPAAAERPPACTSSTCRPPAHCTANGCEGNALPPQQQPTHAASKPIPLLDSSVTPEPATVGETSALAALPAWVQR